MVRVEGKGRTHSLLFLPWREPVPCQKQHPRGEPQVCLSPILLCPRSPNSL